tara:strand:+ start:755 stop:1066 length:312 start_codon:yes stop_codon:yes gene_type:complete
MKQYVHEHEFINALVSDDYASFTYNGARELFQHLELLEEDLGEVFDFDKVAIRCEWSEYESLEKCLEQYDDINTFDELCDQTTVLNIHDYAGKDTGRIIIADF